VPIICEADPRSDPGAPDHPHCMVFAVWGLDLLGPFKKGPGGLTHLLIVVDKFTKWIEVRPLAKIGSKQAVNFLRTTPNRSTNYTSIFMVYGSEAILPTKLQYGSPRV
jgi:hypothetical protein